MEPVTVIVAALAAGALKGTGEAATSAVRDAYSALKAAAISRLSGTRDGAELVQKHSEDPDKSGPDLTEALMASAAADDAELERRARTLLDLLHEHGELPDKYTVYATHAQGVQVGDRNTQTNTFS